MPSFFSRFLLFFPADPAEEDKEDAIPPLRPVVDDKIAGFLADFFASVSLHTSTLCFVMQILAKLPLERSIVWIARGQSCVYLEESEFGQELQLLLKGVELHGYILVGV